MKQVTLLKKWERHEPGKTMWLKDEIAEKLIKEKIAEKAALIDHKLSQDETNAWALDIQKKREANDKQDSKVDKAQAALDKAKAEKNGAVKSTKAEEPAVEEVVEEPLEEGNSEPVGDDEAETV